MTWKERYARVKVRLASDRSICTPNRKLFSEFLEHQEYVLKRTRGSAALDENSFKTMLTYVTRLRSVNRWFRNKSWRDLSKADIQQVYDDLEDGRITTPAGKPLRDRNTYYRIFRGKPFEMAGKREIAREVLRFAPRPTPDEVRFLK